MACSELPKYNKNTTASNAANDALSFNILTEIFANCQNVKKLFLTVPELTALLFVVSFLAVIG